MFQYCVFHCVVVDKNVRMRWLCSPLGGSFWWRLTRTFSRCGFLLLSCREFGIGLSVCGPDALGLWFVLVVSVYSLCCLYPFCWVFSPALSLPHVLSSLELLVFVLLFSLGGPISCFPVGRVVFLLDI